MIFDRLLLLFLFFLYSWQVLFLLFLFIKQMTIIQKLRICWTDWIIVTNLFFHFFFLFFLRFIFIHFLTATSSFHFFNHPFLHLLLHFFSLFSQLQHFLHIFCLFFWTDHNIGFFPESWFGIWVVFKQCHCRIEHFIEISLNTYHFLLRSNHNLVQKTIFLLEIFPFTFSRSLILKISFSGCINLFQFNFPLNFLHNFPPHLYPWFRLSCSSGQLLLFLRTHVASISHFLNQLLILSV